MSIAMTFWQFRNSGNALTNPAVKLGVMPQGQLLNAMEIIFREEPNAARGRAVLKGYCNYRVRQTLEERDFQFVNGQWRDWTRIAPETADDPDPGVQSWDPPFLRMIDTPGWSGYANVGPNTRRLIVNGVMSDVNATEIWLQQIFKTWRKGRIASPAFGAMFPSRSPGTAAFISSATIPLLPGAGNDCRIQHGPMAFGSAALL